MEAVAGVLNLFLVVVGIVLICSALFGAVGFFIDIIRFPPKKSKIEKYYSKLDEISKSIDNSDDEKPQIKASDVEIDVDIDSIIEEE